MTKMHKSVRFRFMMTSTFYVVFSLFTLSTLLLAWFTIRNDNDARLISAITELDANYELYIYHHPYDLGDTTWQFIGETCDEKVDYCYQKLEDPKTFFEKTESIAPSMKFSFVLKVTPLNDGLGKINLSLGGVSSTGYEEEIHKIQTAFYYSVDKISYIHGLNETNDIKDTHPITYQSGHFSLNDSDIYELASDIPMHYLYGDSDYVLVYFSFYFDPEIKGVDPYGEPYTDANVFMNQMIEIKHLWMILSKMT